MCIRDRDRTALITGGSRGIGKMIAEGFVAQGARVYISSRKDDVCRQTAEELSRGGGTCIALPMDVSTVDGARGLAAAFAAHEPKLDILVNNAGAAWLAGFDDFPEKGWDKAVSYTHLRAHETPEHLVCRLLLEKKKKK